MKIYRRALYIKEDSGFHLFRCETGPREEKTHTHDFIEVVYVLGGRAMQEVNGNSFEVRRGDLLLLDSGAIHAFTVKESFSYYNLCLSPELLQQGRVPRPVQGSEDALRSGETVLSFSGEERRELEQVFLRMLREYEARENYWQTAVESYVSILLTHVMRKRQQNVPRPDRELLWEEITDYVESNLCGDLSLSAVAERYFYNPSYFSRAFRRWFGVSYLEYVTEKRLERARELLTDGGLTVDEISRRCGFSDRRALYRAFGKHGEESVSSYRKKVKK